MSFNTKIRLTILASAVALAASSSAFALDAGKWQGGIHTDPSYGAVDDGARHTKEVMDKQITPGRVAQNVGTWQGGIHTDASHGAVDDRAPHTKEVMDKMVAPSTSATSATFGWVPNY